MHALTRRVPAVPLAGVLLAGAALSLFALPAAQAQQRQTVTINSKILAGRTLGDHIIIIIGKGGSISTNAFSGSGIDARSGNTIFNGGAISTTGTGGYGIFARDNNKITNSGTVSTAGQSAHGILVVNGNTIINAKTGRLTTRGLIAAGIYADSNNTVTNAGTISTTGINGYGILAGNGNTITNSGIIATTGGSASAINVFMGNTIVNGGTIITGGRGSSGIFASDNSTITNRGTITTRGEVAHGIALSASGRGNSTVINTGAVTVTGLNSNAFNAGTGNNTVINSGMISSRHGHAVRFSGSGNTLRVAGHSVLAGKIAMGTGGGFGFAAGANSLHWDFDGSLRGGGRPVLPGVAADAPVFFVRGATGADGAVTGSQLAVYENPLFAASAHVLGDLGARIAGLAAARAAAVPSAGVWIAPFADHARHGGLSTSFGKTRARASVRHAGMALGLDTVLGSARTGATRLGILGGFGETRVRLRRQASGTGPAGIRGPFAAAWVRRDIAPAFVHLGVAGGLLSHRHERFVNDSTAAAGAARATARTGSWWVAPEARLGLRRGLDLGPVRLAPSVSARYAFQSIGGYTESGVRAPARVSRRTVEVVEGRAELAAVHDLAPGGFGGLAGGRAVLRAGVRYRDDISPDGVSVRMLGQSRTFTARGDLGASPFLGASLGLDVSPGVSVSLGGEAAFRKNHRDFNATASVSARF